MKKGKVRMKRKLSILLAVGLIAGSLALPSYAATAETVQEIQTIQTQYGEIQVETVLTVRDTALYSKTKSAEKTSTYRYAGSVIAKVTLEATFGYDGDSAWVVGTDSSHTTSGSWSYQNERISESGNKAELTAKLTKLGAGTTYVDISLSCTPSGQIS